MGDILKINGTDFCNDTTNINAVTVLHTLNVDAIPKNCEPTDCYTCGPLLFGYASDEKDDCSWACSAECSTYYSKDYGTAWDGKPTGCTECNLQIGVPLYSDTLCTAVSDGYYSPKNCEVDCERCYTVVGGIITAIGACPDRCDPCDGGVQLAFSESSCADACENTECVLYYSDGNCLICPLIVGDYLWTDTACTIAPEGYYSPKQCEGSETCDYCYTVDGTGKIASVTSCGGVEPTCREVLMTIIPQEDCKGACEDTSCVTRYTNRKAGELIQAGDYIYDNSDCTCEGDSFWESSQGYWQVWFFDCNTSPISPYYNQCVYKAGESCEITAVEDCSKVLDDDDDGPVDMA